MTSTSSQLEVERDRLLRLATVGELMPYLLHETKNPLAAAVTSLELMIEEKADERLRTELHAILVEVRRALLSLDGVGSVGRSLRTARPQAVDHAINEVATLLEARALRHCVTLVTEVETMPLLELDTSSIRAIVLNLLTNAMHACDGGGTVRVRARLEHDALHLDVSDDGCGMSPETLAQCTDLFFTTKRRGSGIGLALCKRLVEEAHGSFLVTSRLGRGTHFSIRVAVKAPRPAA